MSWSTTTGSLAISVLHACYKAGTLAAADVIAAVYDRIESRGHDHTWISLVPRQRALERAQRVVQLPHRPLSGIPFAVKDNIDVAGYPTTAACPDFAYTPEKTASVVDRLEQAGAILIGKTNLDQFATGLVGTRSPYGTPANAFHPEYIPGGSSSGSAVAVATGLVSFALGTDTAGSGRVPAGFNNLVGLKPTPGMVSTSGVFPACRSLDCVSIFTLTVEDAELVLGQCQGFDAQDIYSVAARPERPHFDPTRFTFGVPRAHQLRFFDNAAYERVYAEALRALEEIGGRQIEIDFAPFAEAADLLYAGPWVAERLAALGRFFYERPEALHPVTRAVVAKAEDYSALDAFQAEYTLRSLSRQTEAVWRQVDVLALPTAGTIYTMHELDADPVGLNTNLGYYTNFVNLLGLSALALPAGFTPSGLPCGMSLVASGFSEPALLALGCRLHHHTGAVLGATGNPLPSLSVPEDGHTEYAQDHDMVTWIELAVFGLHLAGEPLNHQLTDLGARLVRLAKTASTYRMYLLQNGMEKPGVVVAHNGDGASLDLEIWQLPADAVGRFFMHIPPPLGLGTITLEDGELVKGFICEGYVAATSLDLTPYGGWRGYQSRRPRDDDEG